ncbi:AAA family ATPase, partial [Archangium sp.]|uniref:AAA family ATPase n=1 Tax=Archangium sp. TaxID=1872627 RepID=UPI002EDB2E20
MENAAPITPPPAPEATSEDLQAVEELARAKAQILAQIEKRVVGQRDVVEHLLIALFARGHCLFVGVPGLAKTLLISTLADVLNLSFNRIQFTPDLMPSDITGTDILEEDKATGHRAFRFLKGPLFANIILADEVNRTPPKTQAALLQAMQEYRVTAGGRTYPLELPFLVFATQNPIEQEGTYPLPEAQLDRFMFKVLVGYPTATQEFVVVERMTTGHETPAPVIDVDTLLGFQRAADAVYVDPQIIEYAVRL